MDHHPRLVGGAFIAWATWISSHLLQVNAWMQFALLFVGLVTSVFALASSRRRK